MSWGMHWKMRAILIPPLSPDSNFTNYSGKLFSINHQQELAALAKHTTEQRNIQVLISNHDTPFTREIYQGAKIRRLKVQRSISQSPHKRIKVKELIVLFKKGKWYQTIKM